MTLTRKTRWEAKVCYDGSRVETDYFDTLLSAINETLERCEDKAEREGRTVADTFYHACESLEEVSCEEFSFEEGLEYYDS